MLVSTELIKQSVERFKAGDRIKPGEKKVKFIEDELGKVNLLKMS